MNKSEFDAILASGDAKTERGRQNKEDWNKVIADATADGGVYGHSDFYSKFIKEVSIGRMKGKLKELFQHKQVARLFEDGMYQYCFHPDAIKAQHSS